jgi:hypothetical protein
LLEITDASGAYRQVHLAGKMFTCPFAGNQLFNGHIHGRDFYAVPVLRRLYQSFFEFFLMNLDSTIWQTVINSSIADLKAGLMFSSLPSCSRAFAMAASISMSCLVIAFAPSLSLLHYN